MKIQTNGYEFLPGTDTICVIYKIHYKVMNTMYPNAILYSNPSKTIVIDINCLTTKVVVPKLIEWNKIQFPEEWKKTQAVP